MNDGVTTCSISGLQIVDLCSVKPTELDKLWQQEEQWWRERLLWDIAGTLAALRRVLERGGVSGKAIRVGSRTVAYACYAIAGRLGMIVGLAVLPEWRRTGLGRMLLQEIVDDIRRKGISRIESQLVATDGLDLAPVFARQRFRTYWREFLRMELDRSSAGVRPLAMVHLDAWQGHHVREVAAVMQAAYAGGVDAEINHLYRTLDGCEVVLDNLLNQAGSGVAVDEASAIARSMGRAIGFIVVTETAPRQGHLAQVVVLPEFQRRGMGRLLVGYSLSQLKKLHFNTFSLIVSRANHRALQMYQTMGFQSVLSFPVSVWER